MENTTTIYVEKDSNNIALNKFLDKFNKIVAKAKKYEVNVPTYTMKETEIEYEGIYVEVYEIKITMSEIVRIGKYQLVGINQLNVDNEYIFTSLTDVEVPKEIQEKYICEHCGVSRKRKMYYILQNEEDKSFTVCGSSCTKSYIGYDLNTFQSRITRITDDLSDLFEGSRKINIQTIRVENVLTNLIAIYKMDENLKMEKYSAYKDWLKHFMFDLTISNACSQEVEEVEIYIKKHEKELHEEVQMLLNELDRMQDDDNEYIFNLKKILIGKEYMNKRLINYILYVYMLVYNRIERRRIREMKANKNSNEYIGSVGDKIEIEVTVEKVLKFDGYYGTTCMNILQDMKGNSLVWSTSRALEEGKEYKLKGTIKEHKEYRERKQTILTRCREM